MEQDLERTGDTYLSIFEKGGFEPCDHDGKHLGEFFRVLPERLMQITASKSNHDKTLTSEQFVVSASSKRELS